jgi:hypothetical protein
MVTPTETAAGTDKAHALVQLLRNRSYEEIRQRMYDNAPGTAWWSACKTELDIRNGEQMATALVTTSRVLEKVRASTEHFEQLADTLSQVTQEVSNLLRDTKEAGRRLEIAVYVLIGVTIAQFFNVVFQVFGRK